MVASLDPSSVICTNNGVIVFVYGHCKWSDRAMLEWCREREKRYYCCAGRTAMEPVKGEAVPLLCRAYFYRTGKGKSGPHNKYSIGKFMIIC